REGAAGGGPRLGPRGTPRSAREERDVGADAVGHLERGGEVGVAHDQEAVGDERLLPVAARRADGEEIDGDDVLADLGEEPLEPADLADPPAPLRALEHAGDVPAAREVLRDAAA